MTRRENSRAAKVRRRRIALGDIAWHGLDVLEPRLFMDAAEPTAFDQYMIELTNRARLDPTAEAARYGIDLNEGLAPGTLSADPREPLAVNFFATSAAQLHSVNLLANHTQLLHVVDGKDPVDRVAEAAGMALSVVAENLAAISRPGAAVTKADVDLMHELLFQDFTIPDRGHRINILLASANEVGAGVRLGDFGSFPTVLATMDFLSSTANYITGVAFADTTLDDDFYTPGEGLAGVTITATPTGGGDPIQTTTFGSGGYNLAVPDGTYTVVASGSGLAVPIQFDNVTVAVNIKVDFVTGPPPGDLTAAIIATLPASVLAGSTSPTATLRANVTNLGPGATGGAATIQFLASTNDTVGDGDDFVVATLTNQSVSLASGASRMFTAQIVPVALAEGTYKFFARVDSGGAITEVNEANNDSELSASLLVAAPFVDLSVNTVTTTFFDTIVPGDKGSVTVNVSNLGNVAAAGTVQIIIELVDGEGGASQIGVINTSLSLKPNAAKAFKATIVISNDVPEDQYDIRATIVPPGTITDTNASNDSAMDARVFEVVHGFGLLPGRAKAAKYTFMQGAVPVTLTLSGPGFGMVLDDNGDKSLMLTGTTVASSLKVAAKGGFAQIDNIFVADSLKTLDGKVVDLTGDVDVGGYLATLSLHDVADDHLIAIHGPADPLRTVSITMNNVQDTLLQSTIGIKSLTVNNWLNTNGEQDVIDAPWAAKVTSKNDFEATLNLSDATVAQTLGSLTVTGAARDMYIHSAGNIGTITVGQADALRVYAGFGALNMLVLPTTLGEFPAAATIKSVSIKGLKSNPAAPGLIDSSFVATNIDKISVTRLQLDNAAQPFGLAADLLKSFTGTTTTGAKFKLVNLADQSTADTQLAAAGLDVSDFVVRIV